MKSIAGRLLVSAILAITPLVTQADTLPQASHVAMRSTENLPVVDKIVVHKADRKLELYQHGTPRKKQHKYGVRTVTRRETNTR